MKIFLRQVLSGAGLVLSTAVATAGPIVLDTEQKAAAGVATALFTSETSRAVNGVIDIVREYADFTLKTVNAATTPAALMSTPGGITINCSVSGTLEARMADALPRVLHVRWNNCVRPALGFTKTFNGPVAIILPADTFRPQSVLGIRFGNLSGEFLQQYRTETPEQNADIIEAFDITLRGDISMRRVFDCCEWVGSSSFEMSGYSDNRSTLEFPSGEPSVFVGYKVSAKRMQVIRSTNSASGVDEDDTRFVSGSVSLVQTQPPPYGILTDAYMFDDYRVDRISDYGAWTGQLSVDGRINVKWKAFAGAGCMDGLCAFKTRAPLVNTLDSPAFEGGELAVNGSVLASFYSAANTPPALPAPVNGMLLSMQVRNLGPFNYDVASVFDALVPVGQCTP